MNSFLRYSRRGHAALLAVPLLAAANLPAQTAAPPSANPSAEVVTLRPFEVVEQQSSGYRVSSASTATRTNTPLIEIPQTVNIVTAEFMQDIGATTFQDSFRFVPGAYVRDRNAGFGSVNLRGFENPGAFATEGVRIGSYKRDMAGYERLEVVKGPPSAVQGRGGAGGLFNYILKKPVLGKAFSSYSVSGLLDDNSGTGVRGTVDLNRPWQRDAKMGARVVAVAEQRDDYLEMMEHKITGLYPSLRWQATDRLEIILANEFLHANTPSREEGHGFIVYPGDLRRHLNFDRVLGAADEITALNIPYHLQGGGPGNRWIEKIAVSTLFVNLKLNDHIDYRQVANLRYQGVNWISHNIQNNTSRFQNIVREYVQSAGRAVTLQGDLFARYSLRWLSTSTLLGWQYQYAYGRNNAESGVPIDPAFARLDLLAWSRDPSGYFSRPREIGSRRLTVNDTSSSRNLGMYFQEELGFFADRLKISGGLRSDKDRERRVRKAAGGVVLYSGTVLNSWRYGATFKVLPRLVVYGVKSIQNDPPFFGTEFGLGGLPPGDPRRDIFLTKPRRNDLTEFGVKGDFLGGRLTATLAYWQLARTNNSFTFTFDETFTNAQGQPATRAITRQIFADAETSGYELEIFGNINDRLSVIGSYVDLESKEANPLALGRNRPLRFAPEWNFNLFAKYSLRDPRGRGWALKAGTNWIGPVTLQVVNAETSPLSPGGRYRLPKSQHTFDLGAAYAWSRYELDLFCSNVGSDYFYVTRSNPLRTFRLTFNARY